MVDKLVFITPSKMTSETSVRPKYPKKKKNIKEEPKEVKVKYLLGIKIYSY